MLRRLFCGPSGPRAGLRLLIFLAILEVLVETRGALLPRLLPGAGEIAVYLVGQATRFLFCLLACAVMSRIERRRMAAYGLPARRAFRGAFWRGAGLGFAAMTVLLAGLASAGALRFGGFALGLEAAAAWGAAWAAVFVVIALSEEYFYRGYPLFTLTSGIGFWPAAVLLSAYFGWNHANRSTETWMGAVNAGLGGLVFCLLLRRSGDLWMPVGFHTAWNWAQTFVYGVPNSGTTVPGHLVTPVFAGPAWLTGGSVGPEGGIPCTLVLLAVGLASARMKPAVSPGPPAPAA